jgi:hypothetical protein
VIRMEYSSLFGLLDRVADRESLATCVQEIIILLKKQR